MKFRLLILLTATALVSPPVFADTVSWTGIAPNWTPLPNPFTATSAGGITVTGSMPSTNVLATHECLIPTYITPCADVAFLPGDSLLYTNSTTGPLTFSFSNGLEAVSTQIQSNWYGAYSASMTAYDSGGMPLGATMLSGSTRSSHDGTADLLAFTTAGPAIFSIGIAANRDFFINQLNLTPTAIPEPASLLLLGTGLVGAALARRRRRG